jgi:MFS family permease
MICLGLVAGYFTCYGTARIAGSLSWRLPFIILTVLTFMYVLTTLFLLPASPRWLIIHGRKAEADKTWDLLGVKHEDRRDLENEIQNSTAIANDGSMSIESPGHLESREKHANFLDLFSRDVRERTFLAVFLMGFLQLCGIDAVLYVSVIDISETHLQ